MNRLRKILFASVVAMLGASGSLLHAQDAPGDGPALPEPTAGGPTELSPAEMKAKVGETNAEMAEGKKHVEAVRDRAKKQKDVIKLNCIDDKLVQIKQLLKISAASNVELDAAIASGLDAERQHRFSVITIAGEKVRVLREEADACVGEEIDYLGPLDVDTEEPDVPDDPTQDDPFDDDAVEPPGYASPFE